LSGQTKGSPRRRAAGPDARRVALATEPGAPPHDLSV